MEFTSKLFPVLFERYDGLKKINVLDLGPATAETVEFFGQFNCKLFFADLISNPVVPICHAELSDDELVAAYQSVLDFPADTRFDLCFFWDFFSLLDARSMQAFSAALRPYIKAQTRAHGFGVLNRKMKVVIENYCIKSPSTLLVKPRNQRVDRLHHHPQIDFETLISGFSVEKATLLQSGKVELLLAA